MLSLCDWQVYVVLESDKSRKEYERGGGAHDRENVQAEFGVRRACEVEDEPALKHG